MSRNSVPKLPTSRLATAAYICFLMSVSTIVLVIVAATIGGPTHSGVATAGAIAVLVALLAALFLGIAAMISITRSDGSLTGRSDAEQAVAGSSAILVLAVVLIGMAQSMTIPYQMLCGTNMKSLGNAFLVYAQDHDGLLPKASVWCDIMVTRADTSPSAFICRASDAVKGESSYALNIAASDKKLSDLPKDMVVLFEVAPGSDSERDFAVTSRGFAQDPNFANVARHMTPMVSRSRWNQVCGPERLDIRSHEIGCNILFADMHVEFVNKTRLPSLRWSNDPAFVFPTSTIVPPRPWLSSIRQRAILAAVALIAVMAAVAIAWRYRGKAPWYLIVTMAISSAAIGWLFGLMSQAIHRLPDGAANPGAIAGLVVGLLVGFAYMPFVAATSSGIKRDSDVRLYAAAIGMIAGVMCSCVVHSVLILVCRNAQAGLPIVAGIPFGIMAGAFLGLLSGHLLRPATAARNCEADTTVR
jgi:hypothetical protein